MTDPVSRPAPRAASMLRKVTVLLAGSMAAGGSVWAEETASKPELEGAVGLIVSQTPAYPGATDRKNHLTPAGFVRWGRFTLSGAGGFTTRREDEVDRGLGAELVRTPRLQLKLGLRFDSGRSSEDIPVLAGTGDIKRTVRARLVARYDPDPHWRLTAGLGVDALNRVGGYLIDLSATRRWDLPDDAQFSLSAGFNGAGDRFMQTWHGITPAQAAASGLAPFQAAEGLREAHVSAVWRKELGPHWAGFAGLSAHRLLGSAADSPLTTQTSGWAASAALVWRFGGGR